MEDIFKKLDLEEYINSFKKIFAREKDVHMEGDINLHHRFITELSNYDLKEPQKVENLDNRFLHIQKQGVLRVDEIFEFVKIIRYFLYLKRFNFEGKIDEWISKIIIPSDISKLDGFFDTKGNLKDGVDEDIDLVKQAIYANKEQIKQSLYKLINNSKIRPYLVDSQVHYVNSEETLLVRGGFNKVMKATVVHRSNSGFFYVLPHTISQLKQKESDLKNKQEELLMRLCKQITSSFEKNLLFLKFINKEFDRVDHYISRIIFAKAQDRNFILPSKNAKNKLVDFVHPALHDGKPITIDFSKSVIMITGVNAGGKTMMLKSILSSVIMSKYLIPYKAHQSSSIGHYKKVLAVLDDPQSVKNDISTFAGRMVEFSKLFTQKDVIVGVDEIELGTDSDEAASLFKVVIEELIEKNIKIIITTHHKRLAALMASNEKTELIAAIYDEENQKPTYEFLQGTIGRSYAFETAQRYGIPVSVVNKAKEVYGSDQDRLNELIERSAALEMEYKEKIANLDIEIKDYERLNRNLKEAKQELDDHIYAEKSKLHKEYYDAKNEAKKAIKAKISKESHRHLNEAHKKVKEIKTKKIEENYEFKVGDRVKYKTSRGEIISIKGKKAFIENDMGMRVQVKVTELRPSGNEIKPKVSKKTTISVEKPKEGSVNLDLHGLRAEDAIEELDRFISNCLLSGFDEVLVYHGIGTGVLSKVVKDFLLKHPKVKSFDDAPASQGGFGAKIVRF